MKWIPLFTFGLIGAGLLVVSTIYAIKTCLLLSSGIHTRGKVVEMVPSGSTNAEAGYLLVEFQTKNGETIRFTGNPDDAGSAVLSVDAAVEVLYPADNPHQARVTRIREFWLGVVLIGLAGLVFLMFGLFCHRFVADSDRILASHDNDRRALDREMLYEKRQGLRIQGRVTEFKPRRADMSWFAGRNCLPANQSRPLYPPSFCSIRGTTSCSNPWIFTSTRVTGIIIMSTWTPCCRKIWKRPIVPRTRAETTSKCPEA